MKGPMSYENTPIPPEFARIAAFLTDYEQSDKPVRTELQLADCRSVLTEEKIENSPRSFQNGVSDGSAICVDSENANLSRYVDDLGSGKVVIEIRYQPCSMYAKEPE